MCHIQRKAPNLNESVTIHFYITQMNMNSLPTGIQVTVSSLPLMYLFGRAMKTHNDMENGQLMVLHWELTTNLGNSGN